MSNIERDIAAFSTLARKACKKIASEYMMLPVYGLEAPKYRERVFCYELYHQLRLAMTTADFEYSLSGEIDKKGHPLIRGNHLDHVKPDLAVHIPGDMSHNLCVLEIKPINAGVKSIADDLRKLCAFRQHGEYHSAYFLFYGRRKRDSRESVARRLTSAAHRESHRQHISMSQLNCLWHCDPGGEPVEIHIEESDARRGAKEVL